MSVEKNKALVREYIEQVWNKRQPEAVNKYFAEDVVHHDAQEINDRADIQKFVVSTLQSFPDMKIQIKAEVAEGDLVALYQTVSGTQTGDFRDLPASGKSFSMTSAYFYRLRGGKIVELMGSSDVLGMMVQLGAIPAPETV